MSLVPLITVILVFAIPILGILLAGYKEWLKFKTKHRKLGTSTRKVEDELRALRERLKHLEQERDALGERVQNLETIVTSEVWILQHEEGTDTPSLGGVAIDGLELPVNPDDESRDETQRTALLARHLRNQQSY